MAGTKDNAVIAVISNLTDEQSAQVTKEIMKAKKKYAPKSRGTIASGKIKDVGNLLQNGRKKMLRKKD